MGADLWLRNLEGHSVAEYRDSYNSFGFLRYIGLSWSTDVLLVQKGDRR